MADLIGLFIRLTPPFKGKWRLREHWLRRRPEGDIRLADIGHGLRMRLELRVPYEAMVWLRQEEPADLGRLREILRPGDVFIDVGANIGLWTLTAGQAVGANGRVIAFEPNPGTFKKLTENIRLNQFETRIETHQTALSDSRGPVRFLCSSDHNNSRVAAAGDAEAIEVAGAPLSDFVGDDGVAGMKIDVEGHEFAVLRAARPMLERSRPWLVVEFNTSAAGVERLGDWPVFQFLAALGYRAHRMDETPPRGALDGNMKFKFYLNILFQKN